MNLQDIPQILLGFKNYIFPDEQVEKEAAEKLEYCYNCPIRNEYICSKDRKAKAVKTFKYKKEERKEGELYSGCGCDLKLKLRSNSKCPIGNF